MGTGREIRRLSGEGLCCSQILIQIGLDAKQDENPELLDAIAGLCVGMHWGLCCGTLTGAACLLSMFDKTNAKLHMIPRLAEWGETTYTALYGGINCECILADDPLAMFERCPKIMEDTVEKCRELLAEFGHTI
jgi:hypothetical protein